MLYYDALVDICEGVDDRDYVLWERAKSHFLMALSALIQAGEFKEDDFKGLIKEANPTFVSLEYDMKALKVYRIINFHTVPGTDVTLTDKRKEDYNAYVNNPELLPGTDTIYIFLIGNTIRLITSDGLDPSVAIYMMYVEQPDNSTWNDTDTGAGTIVSEVYSIPFLKQAILQAIQTLSAEDNDFQAVQ